MICAHTHAHTHTHTHTHTLILQYDDAWMSQSVQVPSSHEQINPSSSDSTRLRTESDNDN